MQRIKPGPGQESVWDYPRPPRLEPTSRRVRIIVGGETVADSTRCLRLLETSHPPTYYIPPEDIRRDLLVRSARRSFCEWKGSATYWTIQSGSNIRSDAGWSYENPSPSYAALRSHVAFYATRVDEAWVDEERVIAQPGDFYGGWITREIVGPFKGGPGTVGW